MQEIYWANKDSRDFLAKGYFKEPVEERIAAIAKTARERLEWMSGAEDLSWFEDSLVEYLSKGYFSLSSPIWSNFGRSGLPISCNNVFVEDSIDSILTKVAEVGMQTKHGAGTSAYLGAIRPRGAPINGSTSKADGAVHYASLFEAVTDIVSQGGVRRGSCAAYFEVDNADIDEVLSIRGDGAYIQNLSFGVCIGDEWMRSMLAGDPEKRRVWLAILEKRSESGYPYIFFKDNVNRAAPKAYKDNGLVIYSSNLCTEILEASSPDESFVCDLASMNLATYDQWKGTDAIHILCYFLDVVMEEYIEKTASEPLLASARRFAINQRAIGVGVLGWHTLLQSKMIPFESQEARDLNLEIFKSIDEQTLAASEAMATFLGEPPLLKGYGERNALRVAVAPTTSSSFILGQVSPSIEPLVSNYFTKDLAKGKYTFKNPKLVEVLQSYEKDDKETWRSILQRGGSVQHLDFLSEREKEVFKTFGEISQLEIVTQAAERQPYIDQGQSLNLMIHPDTPPADIHRLMVTAWELGIKTLYYQRSTNPAQELVRNLLTCTACEA